jgi:hypothetical protein
VARPDGDRSVLARGVPTKAVIQQDPKGDKTS